MRINDPDYHAMLMTLPEYARRMDPEAIPMVLHWVESEYGSVRDYLRAGGAPAAALDFLRRELTES